GDVARYRTARRNLRRSHEARECGDIGAVVFRFRNRIESRAVTYEATVRRIFLGKERAGDSHLVVVGVGGERQQACVLALPAEATDTGASVTLEYRNQNRDAAHLDGLSIANRRQRAVGNRFDETVA